MWTGFTNGWIAKAVDVYVEKQEKKTQSGGKDANYYLTMNLSTSFHEFVLLANRKQEF